MAVISWDLCHNALGRAYLLAEIASRDFEVEVVGPMFTRFGSDIWGPLQDSEIPIRGYPAEAFSDFLDAAIHTALNTRCDMVFVSKPRLPSIIQGLLIARANSCPVLLDIDDHELSFHTGCKPATIADARRYLLSTGMEESDVQLPMGRLWSSVAETLIETFRHRTVSNAALRDKFSGTVLRHARDETRIQHSQLLRNAIRTEFGCDSEDVVILFLGTPRPHKGVSRIVRALDKLKSRRLKLVVIGGVDAAARAEFASYRNARIDIFAEQPWGRLSTLVTMADIVCLPQDPDSSVTQFQVPAKLSDALAHGIPTIITNVPPMSDIPDDIVIRISDDDELLRALKDCEDGRFNTPEFAERRKAFFLDALSFDKARQTLAALCEDAVTAGHEWHARWTELFALLQRHWPRASLEAFDHRCQLRRRDIGRAADVPAVPAYIPVSPNCRFDAVLFWKQNDTGLYGRRHDMMIRHLSRHPRVRKILVIDAPVSHAALHALASAAGPSRYSQNNLVYLNTLQRFLRMSDRDNVAERVFVYADGARTMFAGKDLPKKDDYPNFVTAQIRETFDGALPIVAYVCPVVFDFPSIARVFPFSLVIADLIDDQRTMTDNEDLRSRFDSAYRQIISLADVVTTNCLPVAQAFADCCKNIDVLPNACELDDGTEQRCCPDDLANLPRPLLGYVGNLGDRLDTDLIRAIATARPDWSIVLIGSAHRAPDVVMLQDLPNVHLLGVRPYDVAKSYIANFDVAIMPHVTNSVSAYMNPLKLFVYASLGVQVVTSDSPNISEVRDYVTVATGAVEFISAIEHVIAGPKVAAPQDDLRDISWDARIERLMALIDKQSNTPPKHLFFELQRGDRAVKSDVIRRSGLFDSAWYEARYQDVKALGMDAIEHFVEVGEALLRDPSPHFSTADYLALHPEATGGLGPFVDFIVRQANMRSVPSPSRSPDGLMRYASMRLGRPPVRLRKEFDLATEQHFTMQIESALTRRRAEIDGTLASIVMPSHNRRGTIGTAIHSVLAQAHSNWELLIVDDGSDDGTLDYVETTFSDSRIRIFQTERRGVSAARNRALREAKGRFVFFLDTDNAWLPHFMRMMLTYLITCDASCGYAANLLMSAGTIEGYLGDPFDWTHCLRANYVDLNVFTCTRETVETAGAFDESLRRMVDWDFILRASRSAHPIYAPAIGCRYNNDLDDVTRITNREPLAYRAVVQARHSGRHGMAQQPKYRVAIKVTGSGDIRELRSDCQIGTALGAAFEALGHSVRIDAFDHWYATPPNHDHLIIAMNGPERYQRRPGEIGVLWTMNFSQPVTLDECDEFDFTYVASRGLATLLGTAAKGRVLALAPPANDRPCEADMYMSFDRVARAILGDVESYLGQHRGEFALAHAGPKPDERFRIGLLLQRDGTSYSETAYRRVLCPLTADDAIAQLELLILSGPDDDRLRNCDACIVQIEHPVEEDWAEQLSMSIQLHDVPLFVDVLENQLQDVSALGHAEQVAELLNKAVEVWCPTAPLEMTRRLEDMSIATVPATLDPRLWQRDHATATGSDRVLLEFLCIRASNDQDISSCLSAFDALQLRRPGAFRLTLVGPPDPAAERSWLRRIDTTALDVIYLNRAARLRQLGHFDVGIILPIDFHAPASGSDCQFLEYSALGLLSIVAEHDGFSFGPDSGLVVAARDGDWLSALERPFDASVRSRICQQAHDHVWTTRNGLSSTNTVAGRILDYLRRRGGKNMIAPSSSNSVRYAQEAAQ